MRVLIVEDDLAASEAMAKGLAEAGHECRTAADGEAGLAAASSERFDVLIVDRMMPRLDGVTMVERLRAGGDATPVLFLSALGEIHDRVTGLKAGGDDYLVKPYAFAELIARVSALSRRRETGSVATVLKVGDLEMDLIGRTVHRQGKEIDLQPREFQLLEYLMRHAGRVVTRTMLLESVWDYHFDPKTNIVETHMSRLRAKVDRGHAQELIHTVRGAGYCLREDG